MKHTFIVVLTILAVIWNGLFARDSISVQMRVPDHPGLDTIGTLTACIKMNNKLLETPLIVFF